MYGHTIHLKILLMIIHGNTFLFNQRGKIGILYMLMPTLTFKHHTKPMWLFYPTHGLLVQVVATQEFISTQNYIHSHLIIFN